MPECKHGVYKKSNALFTTIINNPFTVVGMDSADDPVYAFAMALATERGWGQEELAKKIGATDRQTVNNWKRRGVPPKYHSRIAEVFGITVEQLLARTPKEGPREPAQTIYGLQLSPEAARLAADWQALRPFWKAQVQMTVHAALSDKARDDGQEAPVVDGPLLHGHRRF